ncbi:hypothetical protein ACJIZ3_018642 [Penstemon smallii]|uniref:Uncharacterized protein n=1 Tax=Penstemon smallii TaxID=265156 RepID=A0ABD3SZU0_9LAMI
MLPLFSHFFAPSHFLSAFHTKRSPQTSSSIFYIHPKRTLSPFSFFFLLLILFYQKVDDGCSSGNRRKIIRKKKDLVSFLKILFPLEI